LPFNLGDVNFDYSKEYESGENIEEGDYLGEEEGEEDNDGGVPNGEEEEDDDGESGRRLIQVQYQDSDIAIFFAETGFCQKPSKGNLCQRCKEGFKRPSVGEACVDCKSDGGHYAAAIIFVSI